jgi:anti-sigma factor RsiW
MNDREKLIHHIDGNLTPDEARQLEAKLETDADLRTEFNLLRRIQKQMSQRPKEASPGLWAGIEAQLAQDMPTDMLWTQMVWVGKRLVPLMAAAAVVLMAVLSNLNSNTEANALTFDDYFDTQAQLVLSELDTSTLESFPEQTDK